MKHTPTENFLNTIEVRVAGTREEVEAAQHLRYRVFYEECNAIATTEVEEEKRDIDEYDSISDHLIVVDRKLGCGPESIVGTYRLLRQNVAEKHGQFYTSDEYDISPLISSGASLLELGRSCVLAEYRVRPVLQMMWSAIAEYLTLYDIGLMFGCASMHIVDVNSIKKELSYLYHYHLAPPEIRPVALPARHIDMNMVSKDRIDRKAVFNNLPPLFKGYIRLGAFIGDGAVVDLQFGTTDVCIVLPTHLVTQKYRRHYERANSIVMPDKPFTAGSKIKQTVHQSAE